MGRGGGRGGRLRDLFEREGESVTLVRRRGRGEELGRDGALGFERVSQKGFCGDGRVCLVETTT